MLIRLVDHTGKELSRPFDVQREPRPRDIVVTDEGVFEIADGPARFARTATLIGQSYVVALTAVEGSPVILASFRIQHSRHGDRSRCCIDVATPLRRDGWAVFKGTLQLCDAAAHRLTPALASVLRLIENSTPDEERDFAIFAPTFPVNMIHPLTGTFIQRRDPFEIGYRGNGKLLSVAEGEDKSPSLARACHAFYETQPSPHPSPPPKPVEATRDRLARLAREHRDEAKLMLIGMGLAPQAVDAALLAFDKLVLAVRYEAATSRSSP